MIDNRFHKRNGPFSLKHICEIIGVTLKDTNLSLLLSDIAPLHQADHQAITFCHNAKYIEALKTTQAAVCLVTKELAVHVPKNCVALVSAAPYRDTGKIAVLFYPSIKKESHIHPTAVIHPTATVGEGVSMGPYVVVGESVVIGANTSLESHVTIGKACIIGNNCTLKAHVTVSHTVMGNSVFVKPGACIGQPGFGFHMDEKGHFDVPQLGRVVIGNNVHIGANTTIDRGSMEDTVIGNGVRIDNLVQIAHNVEVGDNSVLVAQVGIAGSTKLGQFVIAAGQVGIAGHLKIGNGVRIGAQSGLMRDVDDKNVVAGSPAVSVRDWHKQTIALQKLVHQKNKEK